MVNITVWKITVTIGLVLLLCVGKTIAGVSYQATGTQVTGTGAVSPAWPAHAINDIALLFVESAGGEAVTLSTPAGFAPVTNSPQATGTTINGTRISVFWARATSTAMPKPTIADAGDHVYARIITYRGAITTGNPWNITGGGVKATASTTVTVTGVTTTIANTLIVQAVSRDNDASGQAFSSEKNVNLSGIVERFDGGTTSGNGGGITVWDGGMAGAGATGNTTAMVTSAINAFLTIALVPEPSIGTRFYMQNAAPDFATVTTHRGAWDSTSSVLSRKLSRTKAGTIASISAAENSATNNYDVLILKLVSEPITTVQTISGTLNWVAGSSSTGMNANWHIHAYVTVGDTDTLRGTLVNDYTEGLGINEWTTTAVGDSPSAALTLTPVTVFANDRIVIEVGYVARNTSTTSRTGTLWYGGTNPTDLILNGDETTLPGWWEFSANLFPAVATAPDHIQIEHDGNGQTCMPEILTIKACADAACTTNFTNTAVTGNVTWAGGAIPFNIASGGTGQATVNLSVPTAQTVTLATNTVSPTPINANSCNNLSGGTACNIVFTHASTCFDAVEVGAATLTPIYTKLSATAFSLDVKTVSSYRGTVQVALVNPSLANGNCTDTNAGLSNASVYPYTFTGSDNGTHTFIFSYANAARNVKVRIVDTSSSTPSCSADAFAIRPTNLTVTSTDATADATGINSSATPKIKAGTAFTLNAATSIAGYDGTPMLDNTKMLAHSGAVTDGTVSGAFSTANSATGLSTSNNFTYNEVGYFKINANGVYDTNFTVIDQPNDCTNNFSNTLIGGKYGCKFGNTTASVFFGRFIPDHFGVTPAEFDNRADWCDQGLLVSDGVTACVSPDFSYMGEAMNTNFTLNAENSGGTTTQNYHAAFAKLNPIMTGNTLVFGALDNITPTNLTARLDTTLVTTGSGNFSNGSASVSVPISITRVIPADGPYTSLDVGIAPVDSDGVTTLFDLDTNDDTVDDHTQVNSSSTEVRHGRMKIANIYGSELLALSMPLTVEYWNGTAFITNTLDNETKLNVANIGLANYRGNLATGETTATIGAAFVAGVSSLSLSAPSASNNGSVDVVINLGATATETPCSTLTPDPSTSGAKLSYLQGLWCGSTYDKDPVGRATFGIYKGNDKQIYFRELY